MPIFTENVLKKMKVSELKEICNKYNINGGMYQ